MAANSIAKLAVLITGDANPLGTALRASQQMVSQFAGVVIGSSAASVAALGAMVGSAGFAALAAAVAAAAAAMAKFGQVGIQAAAQMEQARISFEVMTGSAATAAQMMNDLRSLAAESPLNLMQIQQAAKVLMAMGEESGLVLEEIEMLGHVASGSGQNLTELAQVFGQVMQAGRLTGNELRQFNERGVPLLKTLAEMMGKTKQEIRDMVEEGTIGSADVVAAFHRMTGEGGIFANMMERQTDTLIGQWEKLKENTTILASETSGKLVPALREVVEVHNLAADGWLRLLGIQRQAATGDQAAAIRDRMLKEKQHADQMKKEEEERAKAEKERLKVMEDMQKRAESITKSLRTPGEIFNDTIAELNNLVNQGLLSVESYNRGLAKAREDLEQSTKAMKGAAGRSAERIGAVERFTMQGFSAVQQARAADRNPNRAEVAIEKNTKEAAGYLADVRNILNAKPSGVTIGTTRLN